MKSQPQKKNSTATLNRTSLPTRPPEVHPNQSIELLKELHLLTREGQLNQDSRRKLKQIYHLAQFIEPLLIELLANHPKFNLADLGAGKSYLGFIIYDLFLKQRLESDWSGRLFAIESRPELVEKARALQNRLSFQRLSFFSGSIADSINDNTIPAQIDLVTALHACDTATDDAIHFALKKQARFIVLIPCCQAEVAAILRQQKTRLMKFSFSEIFRHPLHTREFGSHLTNVLRCLWLESNGYQVTVTEFTGLEHSLKNELIIAKKMQTGKEQRQQTRLFELLNEFNLDELKFRYLLNSTT